MKKTLASWREKGELLIGYNIQFSTETDGIIHKGVVHFVTAEGIEIDTGYQIWRFPWNMKLPYLNVFLQVRGRYNRIDATR